MEKLMKEIFAVKVFDDDCMRQSLPAAIYKEFKKSKLNNTPLSLEVANSIANAMKNWALENGATHYTHWFQPMTGITAGKHDSFLTRLDDEHVILEFSGKELIKGEPDASSFPSGGLRATFEARGYTAWDSTSNAFIKDGSLCIPTTFCSYGGESLDKKTPLLRSMEAVDKYATKIVNLFGDKLCKHVVVTIGAEQEYFLIDKKLFDKRKDLVYTGRTLLGAKPPKGQELEDHYFGVIKPRVSAYMKDLDMELWKLGIVSKTKHNEVAPAQHELAPMFTTCNIAADHNQLTMEVMKQVASEHGLSCLLHEKPFKGVNGSGKHVNWGISTDTGTNLLEPTANPRENIQFILFLTAVVKAVDEYQDLLRLSAAYASNDHRLGGDEAPPAIVSIFLGEDLYDLVMSLIAEDTSSEHTNHEQMDIGNLVHFKRDDTDRNRTSPFAFTGNKFEFRILGSSGSVSSAAAMINVTVAESLKQFCAELEKAKDVQVVAKEIIKREISLHQRILFNGNNYSDEWYEEAARRGLKCMKTTVDAANAYRKEKNINLLTSHHIMSESEIDARYEIALENYQKQIHIEALTMCDMIKKQIIPATNLYVKDLLDTCERKKSVGIRVVEPEKSIVEKISSLLNELYENSNILAEKVAEANEIEGSDSLHRKARFFCDTVLAQMEKTRFIADTLETMVGEKYWPYPSYGELLFSVN